MKHALLAAVLVSSVAHAEDDDAMGRRVQALLRAHQADVFGCVLKQSGEVTGEVLLRVVVGDDAKAARVEVLKVEQGKPAARAAADCVAQAARAWNLSSLSADRGDQVVFPLAFKPAGVDTSAIGARVHFVAIKANSSRTFTVERPTAFYVLGPGAPTVRWAGQGIAPAVGDVLYANGALSFELVSKAAGNLLQIESTADAPKTTVARLAHVDGQHLHAYPISDGRGDVHLYLDGMEPLFAVDRLCAKKGVEVPKHEHPGSDEIVYIITGRTETSFDDKHYTDKPGDVVSIPRATSHALKVIDDMCAVQVYAPAGPEQRFKK